MTSNRLEHSQDELELSSLMKKAQAGDSVAYRRLLGRIQELLQPSIRNSLRRMGIAQETACEDVLQEALLGIHAKRETYDPAQFFLPWMYAIARYKTIDYARSTRVTSKMSSIDEDELWETIAAPVSDDSQRLDAEQLLAELPEKQRVVLQLVKINGLSIQEAAIETGFSIADIKVTVHRGIKRLQKKIQEAHHEHE